MTKTKIAIAGADGRMGQSIARLAAGSDKFEIAAELNIDSSLSGIAADVLVDFTHVSALSDHLAACRKNNMALVLGTTGFSSAQEKEIADAAKTVPIVYSGNMSIGVNILTMLTEKLAGLLDPSFDIEITETHHRHKKDAPSGTALMLGRAAAKGRDIDLDKTAVFARAGETGERPDSAIGFSTLRGGEVIGDHSVLFLGDAERIEISHKAMDRSLFAKGALTAAAWVKSRSAGLYSMRDVLGL